MLSKDIKPMTGTLIRVFIAAMLASFIQGGSDVFTLTAGSVRAIVSSGIAAAVVVAFNYLNPKDERYGLTAE